jgi:hypothetical protein
LRWKNSSLLDTKWVRMMRKGINNDRKRGKNVTTDVTKMAHLQLDTNTKEGYYPQIQLLDEIHQEKPHAVFIMMFRPMDEWIRSVHAFKGMSRRWSLFKMPGLVLTEEQREASAHQERSWLSDEQLLRWWCGHIQHIREFVREFPSHRLVELDLLNSDETSSLLADLFGARSSCWSHHNRNEDLDSSSEED